MNIRHAIKDLDIVKKLNHSLGISAKIPVFGRISLNLPVLIGCLVAAAVIINLLKVMAHEEPTSQIPVLISGQTYWLRNPNSGPILLSPAPTIRGTASYKGIDTDDNGCLVTPGTTVILEEQTVSNYIHYAKVKALQGKCKDRKGWTAVVNLRDDQVASKEP